MEDWEITKSRLKKKFALLTNSNALITKNNTEMVSRLEKVRGKSKEEIEKIISKFN
jgi:hypothetical protein